MKSAEHMQHHQQVAYAGPVGHYAAAWRVATTCSQGSAHWLLHGKDQCCWLAAQGLHDVLLGPLAAVHVAPDNDQPITAVILAVIVDIHMLSLVLCNQPCRCTESACLA